MVDYAERIKKLEDRITELEDDREIRELLARYGFNADGGRDQSYVDLYTDDGVVNIGTTVAYGAGYDGIVRFDGKKEIMRFITDGNAHKAIQGRCMHVQGNNLATVIDGDGARAYSYSIVLLKVTPDSESLVLRSAGYNEWLLKKVDGRWHIQERIRRAIQGEGAKELLHRMPE